MSDETEEISNEEKLKIAQHFLLSSPPGQFQEVLNDTRKLLPDELLTDVLATGIARVYNTKNGKVVTAPSGNKVVICPAAEVDVTHYIDPISNVVFGIDHLSLATTEDPVPAAPAEALEATRSALQTELSSYLSRYFTVEQSACGVYSKDDTIFLTLTSENPNLRNYWSGKWSSTWRVKIDGDAKITGEIKIHVHYFEDGNVQLQTTKAVPEATIAGSTPEQIATSAIAHIEASQSALRGSLNEMFGSVNTETLRALRRAQTVQRTKMEWNVNSVRLNRQVRKAP